MSEADMNDVLTNVVSPLLREALAEMEAVRPHNPVAWLAHYLLAHTESAGASKGKSSKV